VSKSYYKTSRCFDDVLLVPQYSEVETRSSIILDQALFFTADQPAAGLPTMQIPIISSPMDTVTGAEMAAAMDKSGGLGIIHRYCSVETQAKMVASATNRGTALVGAAVGVSGDFIDRACAAYDAGARVICVDIAHGHHVLMRRALEEFRKIFESSVHLMAGNVATLEAFNDLADWGADSVRVGIGGGSICSTRIQTGHGIPTLQSVMMCAQSDRDALIVADGGIRNSGDIVKSLAAGADFVMLGSLLAGTPETPGEVVYKDGNPFKTYRGMASIEAQIDWRGHVASIEGVSSAISCKGSVKGVLATLTQGIKSGLSYTGCEDLKTFRSKSKFTLVTAPGVSEGHTHIFTICD
jgi:IMP dehydrogenase